MSRLHGKTFGALILLAVLVLLNVGLWTLQEMAKHDLALSQQKVLYAYAELTHLQKRIQVARTLQSTEQTAASVLPDSADVSSVLLSSESLAKLAHVHVTSIEFGTATVLAPNGLSYLPVTVQVSGSGSYLLGYVSELEQQIRLTKVTNVMFGNGLQSSAQDSTVTISFNSYFEPR